MKIHKTELKQIITKLLHEIENNFEDEIELQEHDYFWELDIEQVFNIKENPSDFSLRQISDDWNELQRLQSNDAIPISYDLVRLSAMLIFLKKYSAGRW